MGGSVAQQYLRSTQISGTIYQLDPASSGTASILTKVSIPALTATATIRRFTPEATSSTVATIPAVGTATFGALGWQMTADIVPLSDPGRINAQTINIPVIVQASAASAIASLVFTAILFLNSAEVGRGTFTTGGATTFIPVTNTTYTIPVVLASPVTVGAGQRLQLAIFTSCTNASTGAQTISLNTNAATSNVNSFIYSVDATRTPTESRPAATGSAARTMTQARLPGDAVVVTDTASRVTSLVRSPSESRPAATDSAIRSVTFPRIQTEVRPAATDTASKVTSFARSPGDTLTITDTASKTSSLVRTAAQSDTFTAIAAKATTYGRSVRYAYQPGDNPLIDPTRTISGVVRNNDTTPYLGGARVILFREDDVKVAETTSSTVNGSYSFSRNSYDTDTYYVAFFVGGGSPLQAVTERLLSPT